MLRRRDVLAYLDRDWGLPARLEEAAWRRRLRRLGPAEALRVSDELYRGAKLLQPEWPTVRDREEDLEAHRALAEKLRRASARRR